jgi:ribosome-associated protein
MAALASRDLALHLAKLVDGKGGIDLVVLELPAGHAVFDYALIVTGRSDRQVHGIVNEVLQFCKQHDIAHYPLEGESGWQLIDCYDVVVHALSGELRDFYRLENLWPKAKAIDHEKLWRDLRPIELEETSGRKRHRA